MAFDPYLAKMIKRFQCIKHSLALRHLQLLITHFSLCYCVLISLLQSCQIICIAQMSLHFYVFASIHEFVLRFTTFLFSFNNKPHRIKEKNQMFIILAVTHQSMKRVCRAHLHGFAPGQHRRNVTAVANHWQHCV